MQTVMYSGATPVAVPFGWGMLEEGTQILRGDRYFSVTKGQWEQCSDEDIHTKVAKLPDVVIRKSANLCSPFISDPNFHVIIKETEL